jgi:thioredoxin-dependent peroxiredoxin
MKIPATFLVTMSIFSLFAHAQPLKPGAEAPAVSAINQDGESVDFAAAYAKGPVLVYFYPKADTPGCTAQACSLRDSFADLQTDGLTIFGVSSDAPESQKKFQEKYELPFTLIADKDGVVAKAFGVPTVMGLAARQSFLIKDGRVVWSTPKARTKDHAIEVGEAIANLN